MAATSDNDTGCAGGCLGVFAVLIVIALIVMAIISFAALIDPFDWLPPVGRIWADCPDTPATRIGECDLATRFPGFWFHAVINLLWAVLTGGLLIALAVTVPETRTARRDRFTGVAQAEAYRSTRRIFAALVAAAGVCALVPITAAVL